MGYGLFLRGNGAKPRGIIQLLSWTTTIRDKALWVFHKKPLVREVFQSHRTPPISHYDQLNQSCESKKDLASKEEFLLRAAGACRLSADP